MPPWRRTANWSWSCDNGLLCTDIHLRGYARKNPKQEYERQAFEQLTQLANVTYTHPNEDGSVSREADAGLLAQAAVPKVGRNEPCPCGSGKKYKQYHGKLA